MAPLKFWSVYFS